MSCLSFYRCLKAVITEHRRISSWLLPKQTVNTILKGFLARGWVTLIPNDEDRRNKSIALTETGREFMHKISRELNEHECRAWDEMGPECTKALLDGMALYNRLFREEHKNEHA